MSGIKNTGADFEAALTAAERASLGALSGIVDRIASVVDHETEALRANRPFDATSVNDGKRQGLLELSRIVPYLTVGVLQAGGRSHFDGLSQKLERNRRALEVQMQAVREVSDIIASTMREAESDGTYSSRAGRR